MSTRKRRASTRVIRPTSRASVEHGGLEPSDDATQDIESPSPRRSKRVKREVKYEPEIDDLEDSLHVTKQRAIARRSSKSKTKRPGASSIPQIPEKLHPEPPNWRATYAAIKKMRARIIPPVDQMGCQVVQNAETDPKCKRYSTLVALMLSSQTKDAAMFPATVRLREALGGSISIQAMIVANDEVISEAIKGVGFWRKKTGYLKQTAIKLRDEFDSDVPQTADELCSLPGVGPKMAFLCLQMAWNMNQGIGVDVHVHRITNLLGWHRPPTKNPDETRRNLHSWLPKELYGDIGHTLVGYGQVICLPTSPRCDLCDAGKEGFCPSMQKSVNTSKNRKEVIFRDTNELETSVPKVEITLEEEYEETNAVLPSLS